MPGWLAGTRWYRAGTIAGTMAGTRLDNMAGARLLWLVPGWYYGWYQAGTTEKQSPLLFNNNNNNRRLVTLADRSSLTLTIGVPCTVDVFTAYLFHGSHVLRGKQPIA